MITVVFHFPGYHALDDPSAPDVFSRHFSTQSGCQHLGLATVLYRTQCHTNISTGGH